MCDAYHFIYRLKLHHWQCELRPREGTDRASSDGIAPRLHCARIEVVLLLYRMQWRKFTYYARRAPASPNSALRPPRIMLPMHVLDLGMGRMATSCLRLVLSW